MHGRSGGRSRHCWRPQLRSRERDAESRSAPGSPGRDERRGFGGHVEAPYVTTHNARGAPRLRRGRGSVGGTGAMLEAPYVTTTLAERHGFAGARSLGGHGGPARGSSDQRSRSATASPGPRSVGTGARGYNARGAPRLRRAAERGGYGEPARGSIRRSRSAQLEAVKESQRRCRARARPGGPAPGPGGGRPAAAPRLAGERLYPVARTAWRSATLRSRLCARANQSSTARTLRTPAHHELLEPAIARLGIHAFGRRRALFVDRLRRVGRHARAPREGRLIVAPPPVARPPAPARRLRRRVHAAAAGRALQGADVAQRDVPAIGQHLGRAAAVAAPQLLDHGLQLAQIGARRRERDAHDHPRLRVGGANCPL